MLLLWPPIRSTNAPILLFEVRTALSTLRIVRPVLLRRGLKSVPTFVDIDVNRPVREDFISCIADAE